MRIYDNNYESIRSTFVMDDRDNYEFNPKSETFTDNAIAYALRRSFRDFNFRTLTAVKSDESIEFVSEFDKWVAKQREAKELAQSKTEKNAIVEGRTDYLMEELKNAKFYQCFSDYFNSDNAPKNQCEFNEWHHDTCELFLKTLKKDYMNLCYGKAQKIVNMMFKHLYCLNGAEEYDKQGYFKYCHLTLDSFTLEWFHRNVVKKGKIGIWSNLRYDESVAEHENYIYYISKIENYFNSNNGENGLTPFQFEFYMWPDMQIQLAAEAFYFSMKENMSSDDRNKFRSKKTVDKIKAIRESIDLFMKS